MRGVLMPHDPTGVYEVLRVVPTPDAACHAYTYTRDLSEFYSVEGLRCVESSRRLQPMKNPY